MRVRALACFLMLPALTCAQPVSAYESTIRKVIDAYSEAENKHDKAALSRLFVRDSFDRERALQRASVAPGFWTEKTRPQYTVGNMREVKPDTVMVDVTVSWFQSGLKRVGALRQFVLLRQKTEWKILTDGSPGSP